MTTLGTLTTVPDNFGVGGANLVPGGSSGSPSLAAVLQEHKASLDTVGAAIDSVAASVVANVGKRTVTIGQADLTDAVNGQAQAINIGAVLPANARILFREVRLTAAFSGGGATAVKVDIGGTDADGIASQVDVFTGAAASQTGTDGVSPNALLSGQQLTATFTPDAGHSLLNLTAGSVVIDVVYLVLA